MANKENGEYPITLDRPRILKLDFNTFCAAEGVVGRSVVRQDLGLSEIRALLWAGLRHEDKTLTLEKVGSMLKGPTLTIAMEVVGSAVSDFFAAGEEEGAGATPTG